MSFLDNKRLIDQGDLVLAWINRSDIVPLKLTAGKILQTRYGPFNHDNIIGKEFGVQIASSTGQGFIHVLSPTAELWGMSLPHRTQIVYSPDASYIIERLRIRPGSRVIEAGTGSGALTHALARTVSPAGRVLTYEYHESRCAEAAREFSEHGLDKIVGITHRNVCEEGFGVSGEGVNASVVFLDLPAPWLAIPHLENVVDRTRITRICCFSPCIEQVIKTVFALRTAGFQGIEMVEDQARRWEGHKDMVKTLDEAMDVIRDVRVRRQEGMDRRHGRLDEESLKRKRDIYNPWGKGLRIREGDEGYKWHNISWVEPEVKSHTSYLTFAKLPPALPEKYKN